MVGIIATKCGTTRVYHDSSSGQIDQVTVLLVRPNYVTSLKTKDKDGYSAIQLSSIDCKEKVLNKPLLGHLARSNVAPQRVTKEVRLLDENITSRFNLGDTITVSKFANVRSVDVTSKSKGKGFSGCVKRHGFSMQRATHGNSLSHRAPGSIGQCQFPGRVNPGKKMAGRMGNEMVTMKNLKVVSVDEENMLLLVKGSVPGAKGAIVYIKSQEVLSE
ncbi:MAG: 50S ribosomal protein L3 [Pseudomonadota bacterium]|nr:50S ribosomal protein L3 [Pseudomonadota bacterium]